jgi:hypothetical protein
MRSRVWIVAVIGVMGAAVYWTGCGDDEKQTRFSGNVSSVQPTTVAARSAGDAGFAFHLPQIPARAFAQGTCVAPGAGAALLFCVKTSTFEVCEPVNQTDCTFTLITGLENDRLPLLLRFIDDTNDNGDPDSGEAASTVAQSLLYCNGDQVSITDAVVNFTTGATTATVSKTVDRCTTAPTATPSGSRTPTRTGTPGTPTPTRTGTPATPTPTRTGTPATPTPTGTIYVAAAPLNAPPTTLLAFLFSAGAVGLLLIPRRRRPDGSE